ncbi:MAG TPA: DedA family protein [Parcubacteria group bacterium]|jgi:membrane protein DedA with SNARE-associated domain|nr:DedA family protein [Parcubacteria group bacterium]
MIHSFITFIEQVVIPFGGLGVFLAEIIEEVVVPIPSALVLFTSGFILLQGEVSYEFFNDLIFIITIPGAIGLTLGSTFIYYLGYKGGKPFIEKYGKYFEVSWQEVLDFDEKLNKSKYDEYIFVLARIIPLVPSSVIAMFAGVTRMPLKKYLFLTFIGAMIKSFIYGYVGYEVGDLYRVYAESIAKFENVGLFLVFVSGVTFISYRIYKRRFAK